jgi:hypothetical protein
MAITGIRNSRSSERRSAKTGGEIARPLRRRNAAHWSRLSGIAAKDAVSTGRVGAGKGVLRYAKVFLIAVASDAFSYSNVREIIHRS